MAIEILNLSELQERIANEVILSINSGQLDRDKQVDPNLRNSFIKGLVDSMAAGFDENNDVINQLIIQLFPQTATGIYLERWASFFGINRNSAVQATGNLVFTGTTTTSVPAETSIIRSDDVEYTTNSIGTITAQTLSVSSITRTGTTATVTTTSDHNLATGLQVTISGANEAAYNGQFTITVTGSDVFTYTVSGSPSSPATGTILVACTFANIPVTSVLYGASTNSSGGSQFTLSSPIPDVDDTVTVDYNGLSGGLDLEDDEALRARLLERTSNFSAPFSVSGLPIFIKENNAGVTRVWVESATPSLGSVRIYFTRDNDSNIIPSAGQSTVVKDSITNETTGIMPANTSASNVIVSGPTAVSVDFTFTALSPDTEAMQTAITERLTDYFKSDEVNVGVDITANEYNNIIYSVIDAAGNSPTFTLSAPSGTVSISSGELATLGTITFP